MSKEADVCLMSGLLKRINSGQNTALIVGKILLLADSIYTEDGDAMSRVDAEGYNTEFYTPVTEYPKEVQMKTTIVKSGLR